MKTQARNPEYAKALELLQGRPMETDEIGVLIQLLNTRNRLIGAFQRGTLPVDTYLANMIDTNRKLLDILGL